MGVVLFEYLRTEHEEAWFRFLMGSASKRISERWERYFKEPMEASEEKFWKWLEGV